MFSPLKHVHSNGGGVLNMCFVSTLEKFSYFEYTSVKQVLRRLRFVT